MNPILADIYSTILPSAPYIIAAYALLWVALLVYVLMVFRGTKKATAQLTLLEEAVADPAGEGPRGEGRVAIRDPCRICCARSDSKWRLAAAVFRNIARLGDTPRRAFPYYSGRAKLETFLGAALPPSFLPAATEISRKAVAPRADRLLRGAFVGSESSLPQEPLAGRDNLNGAGFGFYALLFP